MSADGWSDIERGAIVAFLSPRELASGSHPARATAYAKRCVALPGDTVRIDERGLRVRRENRNSVSYRSYSVSDARRQEQEWIVPSKGDTLRHGVTSRDQLRRIIRRDGHRVSFPENSLQVDGQRRKYYIVEQDYYFVLGDSPDMSRDSRHWGLVPEKNLVGKVLGIVWPLRVGDNLS
jgi:signal peptidase I